MVSALDSGSGGLGLSPVFLGFYSHSPSLHPTGLASHPGGNSNTPCR